MCILSFLRCNFSKVSIDVELFSFLWSHYACFLVLTNSSFKKVRLSLKRNHVHPFEGVLASVNFWASQCCNQSVGYAFNVLDHQLSYLCKSTPELIPIKSVGSDSDTNFFSIFTASSMISWILSVFSLFFIKEYKWHAKSVWSPSSLEMS